MHEPDTPKSISEADPLAAWTFDLPDEHIARRPAAARDGARLLHLPRDGGAAQHGRVPDLLRHLRPGDILVANNTRVMAARLHTTRATGGRVEVLLLGPGPGPVPAMVRGLKRLKDGEVLTVAGAGTVRLQRDPVLAAEGLVWAHCSPSPEALMAEAGSMPLPPYLGRAADASDEERYQTVYAGPLGAAAAPTAGLHLTKPLLAQLAERGVGFHTVTLHVGLGTFRPLRPEDVARGTLHEEPLIVPEATASAVAACRARGARVVAVGTTSARALEASVDDAGVVQPGQAVTDIFLKPPYRPRGFDGLLTNFHLPRSSLLMLVACLVGRERLLSTYEDAVTRGYRFYSYGDAMLIL